LSGRQKKGALVPEDVTELTRRGDEALVAGDFAAARAIYQSAFRVSGNLSRSGVIARFGFLTSKNPAGLLRVQQAIEALGLPPTFVSDGLAVWMKRNSFTRRNDFLYQTDKHSNLLPIVNWHWNLQTVEWAVHQARPLDGDFVELGVFKGHTAIVIAELVGFAAWGRSWYLYDTFEGIPVDQLNDGWAERNLAAYKGTYSFEEVQNRFIGFPNIKVIKGRVPEILSQCCPERISFIHMDLNSAAAEISALDFLYSRLVPGGIIVFDDFGWQASSEQHDVETEWMAARGLRILELPTGQGVFIKPATS
jgi:hypothetical protein